MATPGTATTPLTAATREATVDIPVGGIAAEDTVVADTVVAGADTNIAQTQNKVH